MSSLSDAVQGARHTPQTITWTGQNLTGATLTATKRNVDTGAVTTVDGVFTITDAANGVFTWAYGEGDVGTPGQYGVQIRATYTLFDATIELSWIVHPLQSATTVPALPLVGVSPDDAAWVAAGSAGGALGELAYIDDADSDGSQYARKDGAWEAVTAISDVGDLTTTGLTAANMLRVAAAGGLEERTPAQVAAAVQSSLSVGTSQLVHDNSLLAGLAFCFPLGEPGGVRYDKVGAYELTDNNTVTQGAGVQGNAALFTAANSESLSVASAAQYQITGATSFTYWFNPASSGTQCAFSKYGGTANEYVAQITNNVPIFSITTTPPNAPAATWGAAAITGHWNFVHCYVDPVGLVIGIQMNNGAAVTAAYTGTPNASTGDFALGIFTSVGRYFNGRLWQFCKWNRVLTSIELANLYNGGNGLLYPFS